MYHRFFGLKELPFTLSPDTDFFFAYGHYANALNTLTVALRTGEGFIKVTGEVGTGKTLLCRKLLNTIGKNFTAIYIPNPQLSPHGLQIALAEELGLPISRYTHHLLKQITDRLIELTEKGQRVVLCIDEAQAMPKETLEALRLITNLETEKQKLIQVVLFGQPELDVSINDPAVRQLKQRITFSYHLEPLQKNEMEAYIQYRLRVAGFAGVQLFNDDALSAIHRASHGIPRLVNILSHKSLMVAYGQGQRLISNVHAELAIRDTTDIQCSNPTMDHWKNTLWWLSASSALFAAMASIATYYIMQFPK